MSEINSSLPNETDIILEISLNKIAPYAISITNIRGVDLSSPEQISLQDSIAQHGQINPIILRLLRADEHTDDCPDTEYGIIEGHHRYEALKALGRETIRATVIKSDTTAQDLILLAQSNHVNIKWSDYQKGEVIDTFMRLTQTTAKEAGKKLFGLDKSRSYQLHKMYRDDQQTSDTSVVTSKSQKRRKEISAYYDRNKLLATLQSFTPAENLSTVNRDQELATVKELSKQLQVYARHLTSFQKPTQQNSDSTAVSSEVPSETSIAESSDNPKKKYSLEEIERVEKMILTMKKTQVAKLAEQRKLFSNLSEKELFELLAKEFPQFVKTKIN